MISWCAGSVQAVTARWAGAVQIDVLTADGRRLPALAYPALTGPPEPGDRVLLNTSALELGLGTGGYAFVVAIPDRLPDPAPPSGRLVKARYTPLQVTVPDPDEAGWPGAGAAGAAASLEGIPVVIADLHSALPAVLAAWYADRGAPGQPASPVTPPPGARAVYLMLDGGALPAWFSRSAARLREVGWLAGVVTSGQAFGGDLEAVTVHSGLLAARHALGADLIVAAPGPGNLGTGSTWGFSGVAAGEVVNAVSVLGGVPVASLRISEADQRDRHRGVSHHSLTAYGRVALARATVVVPDLPGEFGASVKAAAAPLADRHELATVSVRGLRAVLAGCPVPMSSMGRDLASDPAYFLAAAAAGRHAATIRPAAGAPG